MGSPKKNVFTQAAQNVQDSVNDITTGYTQLVTGKDPAQAAWNMQAGMWGVQTGGLTQSMGVQGQTQIARKEADAANQDAADAQAMADAQTAATKEAIRKRLDAEISLRMRQPGRSQTLLTTGMTPANAQSGGPLLTTGINNGR